MDTLLLDVSDASLLKAARLIASGEVVGMPTETVYGLAADALNQAAVAKIFEAKGRPADNPLIVHICIASQVFTLARSIPGVFSALSERFWPGPLTMILPKKDIVPDITTGGLDTVAIRMPSHPVALKLIELSGTPVAAPSANTSGRPSTTRASHVMNDMAGKIAAVIDGGDCAIGVESTVICFDKEVPVVLRPGIISPEEIESVAGAVRISDNVLNMPKSGETVRSPGVKYKHYSPAAKVVLAEGRLEDFAAYAKEGGFDMCMCFDGEEGFIELPCISYGAEGDAAGQAERVFDCLRRLDELNVKKVLVRAPERTGAALSVYNRLLRAAGFEVVRV